MHLIALTRKLNHVLCTGKPCHFARVVFTEIDGFRGFAIGRSIWEKPLAGLLGGTSSESDLVRRVAENFSHFVQAWDS